VLSDLEAGAYYDILAELGRIGSQFPHWHGGAGAQGRASYLARAYEPALAAYSKEFAALQTPPARHLLDAADCAYRLGDMTRARTYLTRLNGRLELKTQPDLKARLALLTAATDARELALDTLPQRYDIDTTFRFPNSGYADFGAVRIGQKEQYLFSSLRADSIVRQGPTDPVFETTRIYRYSAGSDQADGFTRLEALRGLAPAGYQIGNPSLSPDGSMLFYSVCRPTASGGLFCRIYRARLDARGRVLDAEPLDKQVNKPGSSTTQPCFVPGKAKGSYGLFFASDRKGGRGGYDLYYAAFDAKKKAFANAGSVSKLVNTPGNEGYPYYAEGRLYFSSDGHPGFGGMDVFVAEGEGKSYDRVENLGQPLNSAADDISFMPDASGTSGLLASNRAGAHQLDAIHCCEDIFRWSRLPKPIRREGLYAARKRAEAEALAARVARQKAVLDSMQAQTLAAEQARERHRQDSLAEAERTRLARKAARKDTVSFASRHLARNESSAPDKAVTARVKRISQAIRFELGSSVLLEESKPGLDTLVSILSEHPRWRLVLTGHTDSKGKAEANYRLGLARAKAVALFVQEKGMDAKRVKARSLGATRPAFPNDTDANRARNRRVTAQLLER